MSSWMVSLLVSSGLLGFCLFLKPPEGPRVLPHTLGGGEAGVVCLTGGDPAAGALCALAR